MKNSRIIENRDEYMRTLIILKLTMWLMLLLLVIINLEISCKIYVTSYVEGEEIKIVEFDMNTEHDIILTTIYNYTEINAIVFREEIDTDSGNSDGYVNQSEVEGFVNIYEENVKNVIMTENTYLDEKRLKVTSTAVQIRNATGSINDTTPLELEFKSQIEIFQEGPDTGWHTIIFLGQNYNNAIITVNAPDGWQVAHNPINFQEYNRSADNRQLIGRVIDNRDVKIKIFETSNMNTDDGTSNGEEVSNLFYDNLILLFPLFLALLVFLYFFTNRKKRPKKE